MPDDARQRAMAFLLDAHMLTEPEAQDALLVGAKVLYTGLKRLLTAADTADTLTCAEAAHSLKGSLLNLGLPDLAHIAQQAMDVARKNDLAAAKTAGQTLFIALESLLALRPA